MASHIQICTRKNKGKIEGGQREREKKGIERRKDRAERRKERQINKEAKRERERERE